MSVTVRTKSELKKALKDKEKIIIVEPPIAIKLRHLLKFKLITLIIAIGIVSVIAILNNYNMRVWKGEDELILERGE